MICIFSPFLLTSLFGAVDGIPLHLHGNQEISHAELLWEQEGEGREIHFIKAGCVPSWKPTEFLDRGYDEHNHNEDAHWHQDHCVLASQSML